ncbi:MAG TPA: ATP-grasp domain-containing protein [Chitinophagaceae bacterium]|nr:ATP-grasp domain-containing protein [Chitinophagaceae bacterium]
MFKVLIACLDNWNTIAEIPFVLKKAGCTVHAYCSPNSWLLANSYVDKWIESNPGKKIYTNELHALATKGEYDWVILADDPLLKYMNDVISDDEFFLKIMPVAKIKYRDVVGSKKALADFCIDNNIDTPGYVTYNNTADLEKIQKLTFPVINKIDFSWGGVDMFVSHSYNDFIANLSKIPVNNNILIQEFITGKEVPVEALFYKGELLVYTTSKILTYDKGPFTYSTRRLYYNDEMIKTLLIDLGKKLGLSGFVNITYVHDAGTGIYYLLEADPRPNSWMAYGRFTGRDFSNGVKRIVDGSYITGYHDMPLKQPFIEVALFHKDVRRSLWRNDFKRLLPWLFNYKGYWRYLPFYDKKLSKKIFREFGQILRYKWRKLIRSKEPGPLP